ncbi:MAG: arginine--tRNA ligase [Pseudohongiellaceae bacterium]
MTNLKQHLNDLVATAIKQADGGDDSGGGGSANANVVVSSRPEFGDYQANGVMAIAKKAGQNPRELAARVCDVLAQQADPLVERFEVAGPGFINIHLAPDELSRLGNGILEQPDSAIPPTPTPQTIVVDYSSPNLAKEMHVGHLRGTIIGDCLARVFERLGYKIIRQSHVGDWGTQFGMLITHMQDQMQGQAQAQTQMEEQAKDQARKQKQNKEQKKDDPNEVLADLEDFYRAAKNRFDEEPEFANRARQAVVKLQGGDPEYLRVWEQFIEESLRHCEAIYERLGVTLTRADMAAESFYNPQLADIVSGLEKQKLVTVSDGAKCVFLDEFKGKDDTPLPVIVQKSDGGYLYSTTDLAAARHRSDTLRADRALYVVDARQSLHFQQIFALARLAGLASESISLEHIAYGTMMGSDGKPFKTRSGDVVKLSDLLDEAVSRAYELVREKNPELSEAEQQHIAQTVGIAAVKYADLAKNRISDYVFNWSTMLSFDGNTAPYLMYAYARICSVLRKHNADVAPLRINAAEVPEERDLLLKNLQLAEVVQQVANDCYPNQLCAYLYELAGCFMRFYESCPILKADSAVRDSRLALANLTATNLRQGLTLLGITALDKM